jgi:hypothetical protein
MPFGRIKVILLFLAICLAYTAWMTGFTFRFSECKMFPNSNMLAQAFTDGRLFIETSSSLTDTLIIDQKQYFYSGPLPALLRLPSMILFKKGIPTGAMIIIFCAGTITFFMLILDELIPPDKKKSIVVVKSTFVVVFTFNGFSLVMVSIPSYHNEAISAAMFFFITALYLLIKVHKQRYRINIWSAFFFGLAISFCAGSRISYILAFVVLGSILLAGMLRNSRHIPTSEIIRSLTLILTPVFVSAGSLLWYNYARFGNVLDFGMKFQLSLYQDYMLQHGIFRYDHFPFNFWSFFFRLPEYIPEFPYLTMPAYILKIQSVGPMPYFLLNGNELAVSIFCLMPIMLLSFAPLVGGRFKSHAEMTIYLIILTLFAVQVVVISLSLAAIARYYYDFLALMMMMAFAGGNYLRSTEKISDGMFIFLGAISIMISFALPMNAITFYAKFIDYKSPLLNIFF